MATGQRYETMGADIVFKRSRMPLNRRVMFSYFHGYLHPVGSPIEVLPGDTFKAVMSVFTRMSTPIVPFMDDIRQEFDAYFVPKRILWNKTKQFYGEAPSFGVAAKVYEPTMTTLAVGKSSLNTNILKSESIAGAFGLVYNDATGNNPPSLNVLPIRALFAVYNEFYRDENYQDQYVWNKDQTGSIVSLATLGAQTITGLSFLPVVNKDRDLISSILPYQVKGNPIYLSIGEAAPVVAYSTGSNPAQVADSVLLQAGEYNSTASIFGVETKNGATTNHSVRLYSNNGAGYFDEDASEGSVEQLRLMTDLRQATGVSISSLIYSLAYQDFLARSAHFGTRYREYIFGMFGTKIADASEDIPEYLGRLKLRINVNQVVQTTGFAASPSSELGALGAHSESGNTGKMFTKSFTEPGYIVIVGYTKHQRTYNSGVDRVFLKNELLDYYQPPFANIADVPFGSHTVWLDNAEETSLGFQEPWFDYRSLMDRCYGLLNADLDSLGEIWTLSEKWSAKPTIGGAFMKEDRDAIARVLVTGTNGPDYLIDTRLEIDATRVMPLFASGRLQSM